FQARTSSSVREQVTASTATAHGGPTFRSMAQGAGATCSKSATGRSSGASSISTRTTRAKTRRVIPGSTRNETPQAQIEKEEETDEGHTQSLAGLGCFLKRHRSLRPHVGGKLRARCKRPLAEGR